MLGIKVKRCLLFGNNRRLRVQPVGFPLNDTDIASFFGLINSLFSWRLFACEEPIPPKEKKLRKLTYLRPLFLQELWVL